MVNFCGLVVGVSTVKDGNMSMNWGPEKEVQRNRRKFLKKMGVEIKDCVMASLLGGTEVKIVGEEDKGKLIEGDAFITKEAGVALWMVTADCFPLIFYDLKQSILALVHLGWQGVSGGLAKKVIKQLGSLGSVPEDIFIYIGPGIRKESYIWDLEVVVQRNDPKWQEFLEEKDGMMHIDLVKNIKKQLEEFGVKAENIEDCGIDTGKDTNYFSHYRAKRNGEKEGRFVVVVCTRY